MAEALDQAEAATDELRELAHGILPATLTHGGLRAGVEALAWRTPVPVDVDVSGTGSRPRSRRRAYFVVAEALTNVVKHAHARQAHGHGARRGRHAPDPGARRRRRWRRPDGQRARRAGDRLAVLDGQLWVESPPDGGTLVAADIPLSG